MLIRLTGSYRIKPQLNRIKRGMGNAILQVPDFSRISVLRSLFRLVNLLQLGPSPTAKLRITGLYPGGEGT